MRVSFCFSSISTICPSASPSLANACVTFVRSQLCPRRQAHFFFNSEAQFKTTFTCVAFVSASGSLMQTIFCPLPITP